MDSEQGSEVQPGPASGRLCPRPEEHFRQVGPCLLGCLLPLQGSPSTSPTLAPQGPAQGLALRWCSGVKNGGTQSVLYWGLAKE